MIQSYGLPAYFLCMCLLLIGMVTKNPSLRLVGSFLVIIMAVFYIPTYGQSDPDWVLNQPRIGMFSITKAIFWMVEIAGILAIFQLISEIKKKYVTFFLLAMMLINSLIIILYSLPHVL